MKLSGISRFPIKSCRGSDVERAHVERRGITDDRRWMIVDADGRFVTQREDARLALIDVTLEDDRLRLGAPGASAIEIPSRLDAGARVSVTVWRSTVDAIAHADASAWLSEHLGRTVRVVYMPDDVRRGINEKYAQQGDVVSFADGYPLLLATRESLADLEARAGTSLEMRRFRPNVVIEGAPAWAEDGWSRLRIGRIVFRAPKPCDRCVITTIDPSTAIAGKEPLRTLAKFRRTTDGKVLFGVNLIPELDDHESVEISIGDEVEILA
ncbi:MOSC domain-containing protein [Sandaracinus amylolyticus]|uniref:Flavodoxin reductases (Ferredoxin-NADPH reductases) family 1 n=1 Tax=Sandaracinus amylolyticus TaxID=927083 RepID=A0A0F6W7Y8_9BACT|nr:MOSC N-terminal beta barrel domain-containing protein [Sandaracinus amylolyticus]AKF09608.1 Flavodoxin reductases (ferredoxin-NADPH reductases) family 1 [Sandaracinus amylolyticus]